MSGLFTLADYINGKPSYQKITSTSIEFPVHAGGGYDSIMFTRRCGAATGSTLSRPDGGLPFPRFEAGKGLGVSLGHKLAGLRPFDDVLDVLSDGNLSFLSSMADYRGIKNDTVLQHRLDEHDTANDLFDEWEQETWFCDAMQFVQAGTVGRYGQWPVSGPQFELCDMSVRCAEEIEDKCQRVPSAALRGTVSVACAGV
jgi:hypothetical protein